MNLGLWMVTVRTAWPRTPNAWLPLAPLLLAILALVLLGSESRWALAGLSAGALVGVSLVFLLYRTIQGDLAALAGAVYVPWRTDLRPAAIQSIRGGGDKNRFTCHPNARS